MTSVLLPLLQVTADRPIARHAWGANWWWVWIVIGFIILTAILGYSGRRRPPRRL